MITHSQAQTFQLWQRWPIRTYMYAHCILYTREELLSHIFPIFNVFLLIQHKAATLHQLAGGLRSPYIGLCNLHRCVLNLGLLFPVLWIWGLFSIVYFVYFLPFVPWFVSVFVCFLSLVIGSVRLVASPPFHCGLLDLSRFSSLVSPNCRKKRQTCIALHLLLITFNIEFKSTCAELLPEQFLDVTQNSVGWFKSEKKVWIWRSTGMMEGLNKPQAPTDQSFYYMIWIFLWVNSIYWTFSITNTKMFWLKQAT